MRFLAVLLIAAPLFGHPIGLKRGKIISALPLPETVCDDSNTVDSWSVRYVTIDLKGQPTQASGFFAFPKGERGSLPLVSYQHGTVINPESVPSRGMGKTLVCLYGKGSALTAADYLGMGDSVGFHPYVHAKTESSASLDMLRAARNLARILNKKLDGKLFLTGYSQGGHSTMALFREISTTQTEFKVTAAAPLAGPYDLSNSTIQATMKEGDGFNSALYAAYVVSSYNKLYPEGKFLDLVVPKYKAYVKAFSLHDVETIQTLTPPTPNDLFEPATVKAILENGDHPFIKALKENDVYDFKPSAPVLLCYAGGDKSVSPKNALVAEKRLTELGGKVQVVNVGNDLTHATGGSACHAAALQFFMANL